jgi:predicted chitinase
MVAMSTDQQIVKRWTGLLVIRRRLLAAARRRHEFLHNANTLAALNKRKAQVAFAERVVARHQPAISATALRSVVPGLSHNRAAELGKVLGPASRKFGITTPDRAAAAVAQFAHESARFTTTREFADGSKYEGRVDLGNTRPGDGKRFRGRGYIQITGRFNYRDVSEALGVNFLKHPEKLEQPRNAALASCWFWKTHGCNELADGGPAKFEALTRRINGGVNGLEDRTHFYNRARLVSAQLVP